MQLHPMNPLWQSEPAVAVVPATANAGRMQNTKCLFVCAFAVMVGLEAIELDVSPCAFVHVSSLLPLLLAACICAPSCMPCVMFSHHSPVLHDVLAGGNPMGCALNGMGNPQLLISNS